MNLTRRGFLCHAGVAAAALPAAGAPFSVAFVVDPADPVSSAQAPKWAMSELQSALTASGARVRTVRDLASAGSDVCVLAAGIAHPQVRQLLSPAGVEAPRGPESMAIASGSAAGKRVVLASGSDARGLVYSLLELADRVSHAGADRALSLSRPVVERPANRIRSLARYFESDVEDRSWFHDRTFWKAYLTTLAANRFNRFAMSFGLGYNFPRNVSDVYLYFTYPFLLEVPGYKVRAAPLPDAERDRNLTTLRFICDETVRRGIEFQLALWTHAWQWSDSPKANYSIEGLTPANHAAYCRDALHALLRALPGATGVTFRVHGESGIPEGSYDFWKTVFDGIVRTGRRIEIDMHAKGMDQKMIDVALATGMPVNISPKYWAEHMGLPYHQAAIRELEMPRNDVTGTFALSAGTRRFLRYGYGDLLSEDRKYGVLHRIWPGTQRLLLWGDPALAAGYGRCSSFCGSAGVELCEPLSFKGRIGSGKPGGRTGYADPSLSPRYDFEKYEYTYRVWGRSIYNPETDPDGWRRHLRRSFGSGSAAAEAALANASRALPLITTAHGVSGSNNTYWPEMYTNMPIVDPNRRHPYNDTPSPRRFGTVSAFDPQLFSSVDDCARRLLDGQADARYSPVEVAQWLENLADNAIRHWKDAVPPSNRGIAEVRRVQEDLAIQTGIARFFGWKMRSAVLWSIHDQTRDRGALEEAVRCYRNARKVWAEMAERAKSVYVADVTFGATPHLRGHWLDRLPGIDGDIADMEKRLGETPASGGSERVRRAVQAALVAPTRAAIACRHSPAASFRPDAPLDVALSAPESNVDSATLLYRHVNQAERWRDLPMKGAHGSYCAAIGADYTRTEWALQYYFELRRSGAATVYPGFASDLSNLPYFVVRRA